MRHLSLASLLGAGLEGGWAVLAGSLGGMAAIFSAYVALLVHRANKEQAASKIRLDALSIGQSSLKDALDQAAKDKADLRREIMQIKEQAEDRELRDRKEMALLEKRMLEAERKEADCWQRVGRLTEEIREMKG